MSVPDEKALAFQQEAKIAEFLVGKLGVSAIKPESAFTPPDYLPVNE